MSATFCCISIRNLKSSINFDTEGSFFCTIDEWRHKLKILFSQEQDHTHAHISSIHYFSVQSFCSELINLEAVVDNVNSTCWIESLNDDVYSTTEIILVYSTEKGFFGIKIFATFQISNRNTAKCDGHITILIFYES